MPWTPSIVAYVDHLGYCRCVSCTNERATEKTHPVFGDQYFGPDDACDACGTVPKHIPTREYVHVEWNQPAPEMA